MKKNLLQQNKHLRLLKLSSLCFQFKCNFLLSNDVENFDNKIASIEKSISLKQFIPAWKIERWKVSVNWIVSAILVLRIFYVSHFLQFFLCKTFHLFFCSCHQRCRHFPFENTVNKLWLKVSWDLISISMTVFTARWA